MGSKMEEKILLFCIVLLLLTGSVVDHVSPQLTGSVQVIITLGGPARHHNASHQANKERKQHNSRTSAAGALTPRFLHPLGNNKRQARAPKHA